MSASRGRILIVDDDIEVREMLAARLAMEGFETVAASDGAEGLRRIRQGDFDLVLCDLQMPEMDGMAVLRHIQEERLDATVVVMTAYGSIERAVEAMKAGAFDFIPKPLDAERLRVVVKKAAERQQLRRENAYFREAAAGAVSTLIGESPKMQEVLKVAHRAAQSTATVLLLGESGTGKEVLARAIHAWSPRRERPFVAVNCVALSEHLLESELFGHEKGAFTGAHSQRKGRFEMARGGTILLDEVGAMRPDLQVKLLRVLQEGEFERVGGSQAIQTDVRVIAATNRDLERAMAEGMFLKDLYFRLNVVSLSLPPLRERREDIPALARFFLQKYAHEAKRGVTGISEEAMSCLAAYSWPGNVRELENAVERAVVLGAGEEVGPEDLPDQVVGMKPPHNSEITQNMDFHESVKEHIKEYKRQLIRSALKRTGGNQSRAAELLGLHRTYLSRLLRALGVR